MVYESKTTSNTTYREYFETSEGGSNLYAISKSNLAGTYLK